MLKTYLINFTATNSNDTLVVADFRNRPSANEAKKYLESEGYEGVSVINITGEA
jgi:mannose-1-phosphate guanylyltransferase